MEQVEITPSVYLPFEELEAGDLSLGLAVGSRQRQGGADCGFVFRDAASEGGECAPADLWSQSDRLSGRMLLTIAWNSATSSRASTSAGAFFSTTTTVMVFTLVNRLCPVVIRRAKICADAARAS